MFEALGQLQLDSLKNLSSHLQRLVEGRLWLKVLLAMAAGIGFGLLLGPGVGWVAPKTANLIARWVALPGSLFLAVIQMIVVPLVFASVVRGLTAAESVERLRRIGLRAVVFFTVTTAVAAAIGISAGLIVEPGQYMAAPSVSADAAPATEGESAELPGLAELPEHVTGLIPRNPLASMVTGEMLQVILFAVILGIALLSMPRDKSAPLYDLLGSLQEACMQIVKWAMSLAPIAVFGLMAQLTSSVGLETLAGMAVYVLTVLGALGTMFVVYLVLVQVLGRRNPLDFLRTTREVLLLAFSTSSSAAVMPLSIKTAEDGLAVEESVARFVIPLGATINMTGTALYQGVAAVFLAQVYGVDLGPTGFALIVVTAVAASIGSPAAPGVGMVILAMVIESVGIPAEGVVLLMGVDRLLDMSRTVINVQGDLVACTVLDRDGPEVSAPKPVLP